MEFNPMIEASKFWTLRGNPAILSGRKLKRENAEFIHDGIKHGVVFLNIGDTHLEKDIIVPALVQEAVHRAIESQRMCYSFSEGDPGLIKTVASYYDVPETEVFIVNGVTEAILFIGRMLSQTVNSPAGCQRMARRADWPNVILVRPVYPPWSGIMLEQGLKVELTERYTQGKMKGQPDINGISRKINKETRAIALIPADNPTGVVLTRQTVEGIAKLIARRQDKKYDIFLIVDNIYSEFIRPEHRIDYVKVAEKYKIPLILLGGIDKTLGTGFHGGWMVAHVPKDNEKLHRETLEVIRILFAKYLGANTLTQYAMMPYFNDYERVLVDIKKNIAKFQLWCNKFIRGLKGAERKFLRFKYGHPELPLYIWLEIIPKGIWANATEFADDLVKTTGVLVAPGDPFGDNNCFRVSMVRDPIKPLNIPRIIIEFMKKRMDRKK
ncbi:MAG: pyridoxal phosphate-dependent aminotransferase [Planctomycetota bacterium]